MKFVFLCFFFRNNQTVLIFFCYFQRHTVKSNSSLYKYTLT